MKILVLDCAFDQAFLGAFEVDSASSVKALGSLHCGAMQSHNESVLQGLDQLLHQSKLSLSDFSVFASGIGPGSFTGIRIACATIKALAQVNEKKVLGFSSLQALAYSGVSKNISLDKVIAHRNAYQNMVFEGQFQGKTWVDHVISVPEAEEKGKDQSSTFVTSGSITEAGVLRLFQEKRMLDASFLDGTDLAGLQANYIRPSQAELNLNLQK